MSVGVQVAEWLVPCESEVPITERNLCTQPFEFPSSMRKIRHALTSLPIVRHGATRGARFSHLQSINVDNTALRFSQVFWKKLSKNANKSLH